jgi:hypothetical protein
MVVNGRTNLDLSQIIVGAIIRKLLRGWCHARTSAIDNRFTGAVMASTPNKKKQLGKQ